MMRSYTMVFRKSLPSCCLFHKRLGEKFVSHLDAQEDSKGTHTGVNTLQIVSHIFSIDIAAQ